MNHETPNIEITVNGETRQCLAGLTVTDLLAQLELAPERVAIEHNLAILSHRVWAATILRNGDHLEIVHFVGGG